MTATSEAVTSDGLRLHVTLHGRDDAPLTVLLAHCWTADESDWHYQVHDLLQRYGHEIRIVTWDHRGHGRSDRAPEPTCTIQTLARDLGLVVDTHAPTGPLVIAGHSIGGMTMSALPAERPDLIDRVRGLLFVSTSTGRLGTVTLGLPPAAGPALRAWLPAVMARRARLLSRRTRRNAPFLERRIATRFLFGDAPRARDVGLVVDQIISCPPETMCGFYRDFMLHERTECLAKLDGIPATVLVGSRDLLTPPPHARRIAAALPGAELVVAPEAGHMLPLERPELVTGALERLIDGALAQRADVA